MSNTVFVVGAGASCEVGLPTGVQLKDDISRLLSIELGLFNDVESGDRVVAQAIDLHIRQTQGSGSLGSYIEDCKYIATALPQAISIDNLIDMNRGNERISLCSKLAIVKAISDAERKSKLYFDERRGRNINFLDLSRSWYNLFFQIITENCSVENLEKRFSHLTLIIFNYDRCIEHFLYHSLKNVYRLTDDEALKIINCINIHHPYGHIGFLPWEKKGGSLAFGGELKHTSLLSSAARIKTFTEGMDSESSEIEGIHRSLAQAKKVCFIGFAFHRLNMSLLTIPGSIKESQFSMPQCYATAYGISDSDKNIVRSTIKGIYGYQGHKEPNMSSLECSEYFGEYWRSLSFS